MSSADHDPLDELRRAWKQLDAPANASERPALADALAAATRELTPAAPSTQDPQTQAAVSWMRAAIAATDIPPMPALPLPKRRANPWRVAALAATLAVAGFALARLQNSASTEPEKPIIARAPEPEPEPAPAVAAPPQGRPARVTDAGIEMRAGHVRLLLVHTPTETLNTR